jgi:hypothetical protein
MNKLIILIFFLLNYTIVILFLRIDYSKFFGDLNFWGFELADFLYFKSDFTLTYLISSFLTYFVFFLISVPVFFNYLKNKLQYYFYKTYPYQSKKVLTVYEENLDEDYEDFSLIGDSDYDPMGYFLEPQLYSFFFDLFWLLVTWMIFFNYVRYFTIWLDFEIEEDDFHDDEEIQTLSDASLQTNMYDTNFLNDYNFLYSPHHPRYYRTEKLLDDAQEESMEEGMEMENTSDLDKEDKYDLEQTIVDFLFNFIFVKLYGLLPKVLQDFLKFTNTELAIKNLLIVLLYIPSVFFVILKRLFNNFRNM